jgi:hypothetical protein
VIGELKLTFNLELVSQGVDRANASDEVWLAAPLSSRGKGRESVVRALHGPSPRPRALVSIQGSAPVDCLERDHLSASLAAENHIESVRLDPLDNGVRDGGGWLAREAEFGSCAGSTSSSACRSRRDRRSAHARLRYTGIRVGAIEAA